MHTVMDTMRVMDMITAMYTHIITNMDMDMEMEMEMDMGKRERQMKTHVLVSIMQDMQIHVCKMSETANTRTARWLLTRQNLRIMHLETAVMLQKLLLRNKAVTKGTAT